MNKKLYQILNWRDIEEIVYAESSAPQRLLGPHALGKDTLIQAYFPGSKDAELVFEDSCVKKLKFTSKSRKMDLVDENGYYAVLLPGVKPSELKYRYLVTFDQEEREIPEVYQFDSCLDKKQLLAFSSSGEEHASDFLGARKMKKKGVAGVLFSVYCPGAMRVSVVGTFNRFDGRTNPMNLIEETGIFELFIPDMKEYDEYQYEIHLKNGITYVKNDPFTFLISKNNKSTVKELNGYRFQDDEWTASKRAESRKRPISIYYLKISEFMTAETSITGIRAAIDNVVKHVKECGYTHVELEHVQAFEVKQDNIGYVTQYYAVSEPFTRNEDLMYLVDKMHQAGVGVIFDFDCSVFARDAYGLHGFDGTDYFEDRYRDRDGLDGFDYSKKCVQNFLNSCCLLWSERFHFDGMRAVGLAEMLYLDYGHSNDDYRRNCNGGKENLDAVAFIRTLNTLLHKSIPDFITIADELKVWEKVTASVKSKGLGFDFALNAGFCEKTEQYFSMDPLFRNSFDAEVFKGVEKKEDWILTNHYQTRQSMNHSVIETEEDIDRNRRVETAYLMIFPGRKRMVFSSLLQEPIAMIKALNHMYQSDPFGIKTGAWKPFYMGEDCVVGISAKTESGKVKMVVANFANVMRESYEFMVPAPGKFKEVFHTEMTSFDGSGNTNKKILQSKKQMQNDFLMIKLAPLSLVVFDYQPFTEAELAAIEAHELEQKERERKKEEERKQREEARLMREAARLLALEIKTLETEKSSQQKRLAEIEKRLLVLKNYTVEQYRNDRKEK